MSEKRPRGDRKMAESLAVDALAFLAARPEALARFLALSGVGPQTLRATAADPAFLAAVLDQLLDNEELLLAYADHAGIAAPDVIAARRLLGEA